MKRFFYGFALVVFCGLTVGVLTWAGWVYWPLKDILPQSLSVAIGSLWGMVNAWITFFNHERIRVSVRCEMKGEVGNECLECEVVNHGKPTIAKGVELMMLSDAPSYFRDGRFRTVPESELVKSDVEMKSTGGFTVIWYNCDRRFVKAYGVYGFKLTLRNGKVIKANIPGIADWLKEYRSAKKDEYQRALIPGTKLEVIDDYPYGANDDENDDDGSHWIHVK